jgi:UDP-N-acetyl-2-amino-2-deoxyglucuronate dehydrogenase
MNCVKIAILGAGRVAQHYRLMLHGLECAPYAVVGIADTSEQKATKLAKEFDAHAYNSLDKMLASSDADVFIVLTPSGMHFEHTKLILERGKHVLVEKPMAMTPNEIVELDKISRQHDCKLFVAFQNRFNPAVAALREAIENHRFGKIGLVNIRLHWCRLQEYYEDGWHGTWKMDGGVINQQAIHHIDALEWLVGPITDVSSCGSNILNSLEAEDTMVAIVKLKNGALGTIEVTTAARPFDMEASLCIVGEKGYVKLGGIALNEIETWKFAKAQEADADVKVAQSQVVPNGYGLGHKPLLEELINTVYHKIPNKKLVTASETLKTTQLIHALYSSHEERQWICVDDLPVSRNLGV